MNLKSEIGKSRAGLFIIFFVFLLTFTLLPSREINLKLATGEKGGTYEVIGLGLKNAIEKYDTSITVDLINTEGSKHNLNLLLKKEADIALSQNDVAYRFYKKSNDGKINFGALSSLYPEVIQIIASKELKIDRLEQLKGINEIKMSLGSKKSGTYFNALTILKASGLNKELLKIRFLSIEETKDSLINGDIDIAFLTAGLPTPGVLALTGRIKYLAIPTDAITELRKRYPYFTQSYIKSVPYLDRYKDIPTLGVQCLLLGRKDLSDMVIEKILSGIYNNTEELKEIHPIGKKITIENAKKDVSIPLLKAAEKFYRGNFYSRFRNEIVTILLIIVILVLAFKYRFRIRRLFGRNIYFRLFVIFVFLYIIGTLGMYLFERGINEYFGDPLESIWSTVMYLLSGFEDRAPVTGGGKVMSIFIFIASIFILGSVAGNFASIFIRKEDIIMPSNLENHIIICNWNKRGEKIVQEIHSKEALPDTWVVVLTCKRPANEESLRKCNAEEYRNIDFRELDPALHSSLESSNAQKARSIIILADDSHPDPDAKSSLTALAIRSLWEEHVNKEAKRRINQKKWKREIEEEFNSRRGGEKWERAEDVVRERYGDNIGEEEKKQMIEDIVRKEIREDIFQWIKTEIKKEDRFKKPHIVAEVLNHRKIKHLKDVGVDETICASDYGLGIIAQSSIHYKLSEVYHQLLTYSEDTNEFYIIQNKDIPRGGDGTSIIEEKTFNQIAKMLIENRKAENPVLLVGIRRDSEIILNPEAEKDMELKQEDDLVVMAYKRPDLEDIFSVR